MILRCAASLLAVLSTPSADELDRANPVRELPGELVGLAEMRNPPDAERARLGRWLFFDTRLSADGTLSCATCHVPQHGFSELTPVSTGIRGQQGTRKSPSLVNTAFAFYPETFWDGRAASLEAQAIGPMSNSIEMGSSHEVVVSTLAGIPGYASFFEKAFGTPEVTLERIAQAIADYERTRVSHNSPVDRWLEADDEDPATASIVGEQVKLGHELFMGRAQCATCHVGTSYTDSKFHNLGIGWDAQKQELADLGRFVMTGQDIDRGAFKTPTLREVSLHPPYMHDGSLATLRDVIEHYRRGGTANPWLSPKMQRIEISDAEAGALVAYMEALAGEGFLDEAPGTFPQ